MSQIFHRSTNTLSKVSIFGAVFAAAFGLWLLNLVGLSSVSAAAPIALLDITPGQIRGQVSALFYMLIMLTGLVIGPLAVGLLTDLVFGEAGLRYAAALVPAIVGMKALKWLR